MYHLLHEKAVQPFVPVDHLGQVDCLSLLGRNLGIECMIYTSSDSAVVTLFQGDATSSHSGFQGRTYC